MRAAITPVTTTACCSGCGASFTYERVTQPRVWCSRSCKQRHYHAAKRPRDLLRHCLQCGGTFAVGARGRQAEYCSPRCRDASYRLTNPLAKKDHWLKHKYKITLDQLTGLRLAQNDKCGICGEAFRTPKDQHVDHDHSTGAVRGLLCSNCNTGIGLLGDSAQRMRLAIAYLEGGA